MKSVCISGTYCDAYPPVPSLANESRVPKNPPEPIAIRDCLKWYPDPDVSVSGFLKDVILLF